MRPDDRSPGPLDDGDRDTQPVAARAGGPALKRSTSDTLAHRVAAATRSPNADALAAALHGNAHDAADYEASVRGGPGAALTAGRMMIERASSAVVAAI